MLEIFIIFSIVVLIPRVSQNHMISLALSNPIPDEQELRDAKNRNPRHHHVASPNPS